jgi:hypothetical protein
MKEKYDSVLDERYDEYEYPEDICVVNYFETIMKYSYSKYVRRFRIKASNQMLFPDQRPKLNETEFYKRIKVLRDFMESSEEKELFLSQKRTKIIRRLLLDGFLKKWEQQMM